MTAHTITVENRQNDFIAFIDGDRARWESGRTKAEAIGRLVANRTLEFGIYLKLPASPKFSGCRMGIRHVRTRSGLMGWRTRLQENYGSYDQWESYNRVYMLAEKLGYPDTLTAWDANPVVEGSTNPADYRKVRD